MLNIEERAAMKHIVHNSERGILGAGHGGRSSATAASSVEEAAISSEFEAKSSGAA